MPFGNKVFRVHLTHHPFLTKIYILFFIGTHSLSDKINSLLLMSNINLNRVSRNYSRIDIYTWKQNIFFDGHRLDMATDHPNTGSSDTDRGHSLVLFLHPKRDSRLHRRV